MEAKKIDHIGIAVFDLEHDEIVLSGGVTLNSEDGTTLTAPTAVFQRSKGTIEFPEGGSVRFQQGQIEAPLISVDLEKDDGPARRIELAGGVDRPGADEIRVRTGFQHPLRLAPVQNDILMTFLDDYQRTHQPDNNRSGQQQRNERTLK